MAMPRTNDGDDTEISFNPFAIPCATLNTLEHEYAPVEVIPFL
jgi:hypothetical protein